MPPVRVHRTAVLPPQHEQAGRPPRTALGRAVVDGAAWAETDREARLLIAAACQQGRVSPAQIREALSWFPTIRRHHLITVTIADIEGGATALSEIDLTRLCRQYRLPAPRLQQRRTTPDGRTRFVDAYWPEQRLMVEVDGAHHLSVRQWSADMLRQNQLWIDGERILRFPAWLLRSEPATVAAQLRAALRLPAAADHRTHQPNHR